MNIPPVSNLNLSNSLASSRSDKSTEQGKLLENALESQSDVSPFQEAFRDFVGQTFFGQMLASLRSTQQEPAYFHGGQAEKIFQGQLDQKLAEDLAEKSASKVADPMFHLYQLRQR